MSSNFGKTQQQAYQIEGFEAYLSAFCRRIAPYGDCVDLSEILEMENKFSQKAEEFFRQDRKFNLAVLGQVKAGKSSFLNMLLFDGEAVLPQAATPKTAALTKIEYAQTNRFTVEYMTQEEWEQLGALASLPAESTHVRAARETLSLAVDLGTPVEECFKKRQEEFTFETEEGLMERLNQYVGEDGMYTPVVKSVVLGLDLEQLKNLSVVDTPGLNDPVPSRTQRTREFIEQCDAAFFLSRSGYFLDRNDMELLTAQLPQKGVGRLTLIASQYDGALMDTLPDYSSFQEADQETKARLRRHAAQSVDRSVDSLRRIGAPEPVIQVVEQCRRPVFVSVVAQRLSEKPQEEDNPREAIVREQLGYYEPATPQRLAQVGNFSQVREIFRQMVEEKEELLRKKAAVFVQVAKSDLAQRRGEVIGLVRQAIQERKENLARQIEDQRRLSDEVNGLRRDVDQVFHQYIDPLDDAVASVEFALKPLLEEWSQGQEQTQLELVQKVDTVRAWKLWNPLSWGKTQRHYSNEETSFTVLDPAQLRGDLRHFSHMSGLMQEEAFAPFFDPALLVNDLLELMQSHFSQESPLRAPEFLRKLTEETVKRLRFTPVSPLSDPGQLMPSQFIGPVREETEKKRLLQAAAEAGKQLYMQRREQIELVAHRLKESVGTASTYFLQQISGDFVRRQSEQMEGITQCNSQLRRLEELGEILDVGMV